VRLCVLGKETYSRFTSIEAFFQPIKGKEKAFKIVEKRKKDRLEKSLDRKPTPIEVIM